MVFNEEIACLRQKCTEKYGYIKKFSRYYPQQNTKNKLSKLVVKAKVEREI